MSTVACREKVLAIVDAAIEQLDALERDEAFRDDQDQTLIRFIRGDIEESADNWLNEDDL